MIGRRRCGRSPRQRTDVGHLARLQVEREELPRLRQHREICRPRQASRRVGDVDCHLGINVARRARPGVAQGRIKKVGHTRNWIFVIARRAAIPRYSGYGRDTGLCRIGHKPVYAAALIIPSDCQNPAA
jgi:hypothetical protein